MGKELRIQKFLSENGICSRREAERLIEQGEVRVNGHVVEALGTKIDPDRDTVSVSGKKVTVAPKALFIFHKPMHVVCTMSDPERRPCVADYLPKKWQGLFPVGRLDFESTGLLLFTNDGEVAQRLTHPKYEVERRYRVKVKGSFGEARLNSLKKGVRLKDGVARADARVIRFNQSTSVLEMTLTSGKNRVIRRMIEALGSEVLKLHRLSHGPIHLGNLEAGQLSKVSDADYRRLRASLGL